MELEHNPPHMILSVGNTVSCIMDPYFDRHITTSMYRAMPEMWLIPEPKARRKKNDRWLQHDGPPTHLAATICDILNDQFSCCWIGHGSKMSPTTLMWHPHNLDLTSQKILCGIIKEYVAACHYCTNKELHWVALRAFTIITAQTLRGCHAGHGSAVDSILSMVANNQ